MVKYLIQNMIINIKRKKIKIYILKDYDETLWWVSKNKKCPNVNKKIFFKYKSLFLKNKKNKSSKKNKSFKKRNNNALNNYIRSFRNLKKNTCLIRL
jgi:hypothetical protein